MPDHQSLGGRHIARLADGVLRARLVDSILAGRPPVVAVCAPSGYGKTVLAAQIASSEAFDRVIWLDAGGDSGSVRECLVSLREALLHDGSLAHSADASELASLCASEMAVLEDCSRVAVIVDDIGAAWDDDDAALLLQVASEAPVGSIMVLTSRRALSLPGTRVASWHLDHRDLSLTDDELAALWESVGLEALERSHTPLLVEASGRHAALAALVVRQCALSGGRPTDLRAEGGIGAAVVRLSHQLNEHQLAVLRVAACLGEGSLQVVAECLGLPSVAADLAAISMILPLVAVSGAGPGGKFTAHAILDEVLDCSGELARGNPDVVAKIAWAMAGAEMHLRAVAFARSAGDVDLLARLLAEIRDPIIIESHSDKLRDCLAEVPAAALAGDPSLLLLASQLQWQAYEPAEAIKTAMLAQQLATHLDDAQLATRAQTLVLRMRGATGELEGMTDEVRRMLGQYRPYLDAENLALAAFAGIMAFGLMGDRDGLLECLAIERRLRRSADVSVLTRFRMSIAHGVVLALAKGAWPESADAFMRAVELPLFIENTAAIASQNRSVSLLEMGRIEEALASAGVASGGVDGRPSGVDSLAALVAAGAGIARGQLVDLRSVAEDAYEEAVCIGDWLSAATSLQFAAPLALIQGDLGYWRSLAERAVDCSMKTGSPVLLWRAQLLQAQGFLALGDCERARRTAELLLPQALASEADGHVLHARMILAVIATRAGDLSRAVEHLASAGEGIAANLPLITVASYITAFPEVLGPLALAMGIGRIPSGLWPLLSCRDASVALEQAATVLSPKEHELLTSRMKAHDQQEAGKADGAVEDAVCQVHLFGGLEVVTPRGKVGDRDWAKRKARLLFAMLVSRFGTDVPRGEIIEYLWPEMDEERALNNFYVVWSAMKRAISPESIRDTPCPFVEHVRGVCRVVKGRVVSDLEEFTDLLSASRDARRMGDSSAELTALRRIADIYRGEVLPGDVYDDWFAPLRDRFRHDFEDAMLRASAILEEQGDPHGGLQMLRRAMAADPWREDLYQAQLRLQIAAGQRSAAIETYMLCRSRLTADLGIDPSRETTALYEQVLGMEEPDGLARL